MIDRYREQRERDFGFEPVPSTCPQRFKNRIVEIRSAIIEGRAIPAPTAEYRAQAQEALSFVNKLFQKPTPTVDANAERIENLRRRAQIVSIF